MIDNQSKIELLCIALCHSHNEDPYGLTKLEVDTYGAQRWGSKWKKYEPMVTDFLTLHSLIKEWP